MIFFLAKIFEKKEHADDLVRGKLFVNRLSYFKKIEGDDGRGDEDEGAIMVPIEGSIIELQAKNPLTEKDLAAPPVIRPEWFDHINIYCMYAGHTGDFQYISSDNVEDFKRQLEPREDAEKLGKHAVVLKNGAEFIRRVRIAAEHKGYKVCTGLVRYYDPEVGSPPLRSEIETIFTKRKDFEYQKEFRIAISADSDGCHPIILEIGDIRDIAVYAKTSDIDVNFRLKDKSL